MELLESIWGSGDQLNPVQMSIRGIASFILALVMIRVSGRRSFGVRTPLDNIIVILLGAVLSRGVVGASPFLSVIATCFCVVLLHRLFAILIVKSPRLSRLAEGSKILLFQNGRFDRHNLKRALLSEEDVLQEVRQRSETDDLSGIDRIYMERDGEISTVKKNA